MTGPEIRRAVHLDLGDATVRLALTFACREAGWDPLPAPAPNTVVVGDGVPAPGSRRPGPQVLVVAPTPIACRRALDAFGAGAVRAVVSSAEPWGLPPALDLVRRGVSVIPQVLVDEALRFPRLRPRLERTLELVVRGATIAGIARTLHLSPSSTKRDIAELLRLFDAPTRLALVATAVRLGVRPGPG